MKSTGSSIALWYHLAKMSINKETISESMSQDDKIVILEDNIKKLEEMLIKQANSLITYMVRCNALLRSKRNSIKRSPLPKSIQGGVGQYWGPNASLKTRWWWVQWLYNKTPKTKDIWGTWDSKEVYNFIIDMEQYFWVCHLKESVKVDTVHMYLVDNAMLWWRTRFADILA